MSDVIYLRRLLRQKGSIVRLQSIARPRIDPWISYVLYLYPCIALVVLIWIAAAAVWFEVLP